MQEEILEKNNSLERIPADMSIEIEKQYAQDTTFSQQQFLDIANIYLREVYKRATGRKSTGQKFNDLRQEALVVALIAMLAAKALSLSMKTLTSVKKIKEVIFEGTGLAQLEQWLEKNAKDQEAILSMSGKRNLIEQLLDLRYITDTHEYFTFEKMKTIVTELTEWLKVVAALNKNAETQPHFSRLANSIGGGGYVWNKDRVYMSLIIGITLGRERILFTIDDIIRFCEIVRNEAWVQDVTIALSAVEIEDLGTNLADIRSVKNIIAEMNMPYNKTVFFYAKKVGWGNTDQADIVRAGDGVFTRSAVTITTFDPVRNEERLLQEMKKKVSATIGNQPMGLAYDFLIAYPYFLMWLTDEELFRMAIYDHFNGQQLQAIAKTFDIVDDMKKQIDYIQTKVSIANVVNDIVKGEQLFGIKLSFFMKNKSLFNPKRKVSAKMDIKKLYRKVMLRASRTFSAREFSDWVSMLEQKIENTIIQFDGIHISYIAGSYMLNSEAKRPKSIVAAIQAMPWAKFIDDYALEYFKKKIQSKAKKKKVNSTIVK